MNKRRQEAQDRLNRALDEVDICDRLMREQKTKIERTRVALKAVSAVVSFEPTPHTIDVYAEWGRLWVEAADQVRAMGVTTVLGDGAAGTDERIVQAVFEMALCGDNARAIGEQLHRSRSRFGSFGWYVSLRGFLDNLKAHLCRRAFENVETPKNLSPSEGLVFRLLAMRRPMFASAGDVEDAFGGNTKASAIIKRLRNKRIPIESARDVRAAGEAVPPNVSGYRLERLRPSDS